MTQPSVSDKIYRSTKLAAVVDALLRDGISVDDALRDLGVKPSELHSPDTLVSLEQLLSACRIATRLSRDPILPFRIGSSIHVSTYGMYGYAILCGTDFRRTFDFCKRYHVLAAPLVSISHLERDGTCCWTIDPILHHLIDERLYRFIVEMQMGVHISLQRDIMGSAFTPHELTLTYSRCEDFHLTEELLRMLDVFLVEVELFFSLLLLFSLQLLLAPPVFCSNLFFQLGFGAILPIPFLLP